MNTSPNHCDGLGYVMYSPITFKFMKYDAIDHPKPTYSVCEDNLKVLDLVVSKLGMELRRVAGVGTYAFLLLHTRRASKGEPRGTLHAHPYIVSSLSNEGPITYFFMHNGGINKDSMIKSLNLNLEPSSLTDSNLIAHTLLNNWDGEDLNEFIKQFINVTKFVKSALITATLVIKPSKTKLIATSYLRKDLSSYRRRYYRTYLVIGEEYIAIASSTIYDMVKDIITPKEVTPLMEYGEVITVNENLTPSRIKLSNNT